MSSSHRLCFPSHAPFAAEHRPVVRVRHVTPLQLPSSNQTVCGTTTTASLRRSHSPIRSPLKRQLQGGSEEHYTRNAVVVTATAVAVEDIDTSCVSPISPDAPSDFSLWPLSAESKGEPLVLTVQSIIHTALIPNTAPLRHRHSSIQAYAIHDHCLLYIIYTFLSQ